MGSRSFQEMGIPPGYGLKQLLFSPAADALIMQAQSSGKQWRPERLYVRGVESDKYSLIGQPADLVSQDFPFVHPSKPLLAYNCLEHRFSVDASGEERHSGDWDSVKLHDLGSGLELDCINRETLTLPSGIVRGWISSLVAFSDSGLFVQAGLSKQGSSRMDYFIAELDFSRHLLKPITTLPATFI